MYGYSSSSIATVKNWFNEFQCGRMLVFDEPHPGAPKMATTGDNVTKIHDLVLADRRLMVGEIAETVGISKDRVGHILHEILGMRKLSVRWVPRLLTLDNKRNHETPSEQRLTQSEGVCASFCDRRRNMDLLVHTVETVDFIQ